MIRKAGKTNNNSLYWAIKPYFSTIKSILYLILSRWDGTYATSI